MINGIKIILYGTLHNKSATVKNIYSVIDIHMGLAPGPLQMLKSRDAQVPYVKCQKNLHTTYAHPPLYFKSSLGYL